MLFLKQEGELRWNYGNRYESPEIDRSVGWGSGLLMVRLGRMVLPGIPHHETQRGTRRERTFFEEGDSALYLDLLAAASVRYGVEIWSYCMMPNHVHVIAVSRNDDALGQISRTVHRHNTAYHNARLRATGHLCQVSSSDGLLGGRH